MTTPAAVSADVFQAIKQSMELTINGSKEYGADAQFAAELLLVEIRMFAAWRVERQAGDLAAAGNSHGIARRS